MKSRNTTVLLVLALLSAGACWQWLHHHPVQPAALAAPSGAAQSAPALPSSPLMHAWAPVGVPSWDQRVSDARSEQLRLQGAEGASAAQRAAGMHEYLQANFSPAERTRVEALLRLMPD